MVTSAKLREPWHKKVYFLKLHMSVYLHNKFQVSSSILTSFKQGNFTPPLPQTQNEPLKSPPRLGLIDHGIKATLALQCAKIKPCY